MIKRKFYKKLFIIYISFTLVYGFIITSIFVVQNKRTVDQQQLDGMLAEITQQSRNIDQRVTSFVKYVDTLYLDSDFKQFLVSNDDYYVIARLYEKLSRDMSVFSDVEGRIVVSFVSDDLYISNQSTMNQAQFLAEYDFDVQEESVIYNYYKNGKNRKFMVMQDERRIHLLYVLGNAYSKKDRILIIQSMSKDKLATLHKDKYLNIVIDSEEKENYTIEDRRLVYMKQSNILPSIMYEFDFPFERQSIFSVQFYTGILIYLGIVVIGSVFATLVARSTYKPIRNIMETFEENNEDKQDEFAFLSKITQDIKKANSELNSTLYEQKIDIKTKVIRELAHGINYDEQLELIDNDYNLKNLNSNSRIVIINIEEDNNYNDVYLSDARNNIRNNIYTIIERALTLEGLFYELVELNSNQFGIVLANLHGEALENLLSKLIKVIEVEEEVNIVFVVGREVDSLGNLEASYQSAIRTLDYRSNFDKRAIIFYSEMDSVSLQSVYFYPIDIERELIIQTLQGQYNKIEQIFDRIYQINFVEHCIDRSEKRKLIVDMIGTLRRVYQKMLHNNERNEELEVIKLFENNRYHEDEIYKRLKITFLNFSDIVQQRSHSKAVEYSTEMIRYIKEHYHEDISLEEVATHLNLSTGYFSTIFKKETGENFKSYLNKYRVKKAKEYLSLQPDIKIKDLSVKVGYFNVNSFIRMFKKYEGVSPGEYAKGMNKSK